jgi:hypothetical protein
MNLYSYVSNDPISAIDRLGLDTLSLKFGGSGGAGAGGTGGSKIIVDTQGKVWISPYAGAGGYGGASVSGQIQFEYTDAPTGYETGGRSFSSGFSSEFISGDFIIQESGHTGFAFGPSINLGAPIETHSFIEYSKPTLILDIPGAVNTLEECFDELSLEELDTFEELLSGEPLAP